MVLLHFVSWGAVCVLACYPGRVYDVRRWREVNKRKCVTNTGGSRGTRKTLSLSARRQEINFFSCHMEFFGVVSR